MHIAYLAFIRLPTEKAHGLQIMKECEALAVAGATVELVVPGRTTSIHEDPFTYYGVSHVFTIRTVKTPDLMRFGALGFVFSQLLFGHAARSSISKDACVISQDEWVLRPLFGRLHHIVYEVHNGRANVAARYAARHAALMVANSNGTKRFYVRQGVPEERIMVIPNGVDRTRFDPPESRDEARARLGLSGASRLVVYTGHLYDWKGADTLAESAHELPHGTEVVFVGGTPHDVERFRMAYGALSNIRILGHQPNTDMPLYLRAADVLVLPNARAGESEQFTSPMKLFEYLAAGKPIIASDLPSIREILDEHTAFFFEPGNAHALAMRITNVLADSGEAQARAHAAKEASARYTWDRRALLARLATHVTART